MWPYRKNDKKFEKFGDHYCVYSVYSLKVRIFHRFEAIPKPKYLWEYSSNRCSREWLRVKNEICAPYWACCYHIEAIGLGQDGCLHRMGNSKLGTVVTLPAAEPAG